jgi:outer membrane protein
MPVARHWNGLARALALCAMLGGGAAHAQFANRAIGFSVGYLQLNDNIINRAFPVGLMGTAYLEDGWEATVRVHGLIVTLQLTGLQAFAVDGGLGIRYLFLQEQFRPYAGLELSYFQLLGDAAGGLLNYVGVSPAVGFDLMLGPQVSVGPRGQVNVYWMINRTLNIAYQATVELGFHF